MEPRSVRYRGLNSLTRAFGYITDDNDNNIVIRNLLWILMKEGQERVPDLQETPSLGWRGFGFRV